MSRGGNPASVFRPTPTLAPIPIAALLTGGRQVALAVADVSVGNWTTETGGTTNEYLSVSEASPSDYNYVQAALVQSALVPATDVIEFTLRTLLTPISGATPVLHYRYDEERAGMQGRLTVELLQDGIVVQTWTHTDLPADWTGADQVVTGVTDYTALLQVRFSSTQP